jgi:AraC-like DNA-binding protein
MITFHSGMEERIYPIYKLSAVIAALRAEGVSPEGALGETGLAEADLTSASTRISLKQLFQVFHNCIQYSADPYFAYHAGRRFHVSTYGMYGFAILSSMNFRQTAKFVVDYHQLATPHANIAFEEGCGHGYWITTPLPDPIVDAALYRFVVELQFGLQESLHKDVMGPTFSPKELHVSYLPVTDPQVYRETFGCPVVFGQSDNRFVFDAKWLDGEPPLGNRLSYAAVIELCDQLYGDLRLRAGMAGRVREILLVSVARPPNFSDVAQKLDMAERSLRRRLQEEGVSYQSLLDEIRMRMAIKFLRETSLTVEDIAFAIGFGDAANFRHAFRRWTGSTPSGFRRLSRSGDNDVGDFA